MIRGKALQHRDGPFTFKQMLATVTPSEDEKDAIFRLRIGESTIVKQGERTMYVQRLEDNLELP